MTGRLAPPTQANEEANDEADRGRRGGCEGAPPDPLPVLEQALRHREQALAPILLAIAMRTDAQREKLEDLRRPTEGVPDMRSILPFVVAVTLAACNVIEPEGRQQTATFTTSLTPQQTRARAEDWLAARARYEVTSAEPVFVRGETRRPRTVGPGDQIDVLSVAMASVNEGTRVEVQALTFEVAGSGARNRADQVSPEALADHAALIEALMARPF